MLEEVLKQDAMILQVIHDDDAGFTIEVVDCRQKALRIPLEHSGNLFKIGHLPLHAFAL